MYIVSFDLVSLYNERYYKFWGEISFIYIDLLLMYTAPFFLLFEYISDFSKSSFAIVNIEENRSYSRIMIIFEVYLKA